MNVPTMGKLLLPHSQRISFGKVFSSILKLSIHGDNLFVIVSFYVKVDLCEFWNTALQLCMLFIYQIMPYLDCPTCVLIMQSLCIICR